MTKFWKDWEVTVFVGVSILVAAALLRIYDLTHLPVFADEAIYMRWAQVMKAEPSLRFLPLSDGKQPLFMWVVMGSLSFFSNPLFASRIVSVFTGLATLIGVFSLSYLLFRSKKVSFVASLVYAISPYSIFFDRLGLVDSMLSMFGIWTFFFFVLAAKSLRLDFAMLAGFTLGGALLTKSPALFFVLFLPTLWFFANWGKGNRSKAFVKLFVLTIITLVIGYGMYNILRLGPNFHLIASRNQDYVHPLTHILESPFDPFVSHMRDVGDWFWRLSPGIALVLFVAALFLNARKFPKEFGVLLIWFIVPIMVQSEYAKAFTTRYVFFTIPYFAIIVGSLFLYTRRSLTNFFTFGLIVFLIHSSAFNYLVLTNTEKAPLPRVMRSGYLEEWTSGSGIYEISELIKSEFYSDPNQKIVVGTEGYFGTLPDALQAYLNDLPEVVVIGVGLDFTKLPEQLVESKEAGNKTFFVVNSSRLKIDPSENGLVVKGAYPKAFRPEGTREFVVHGPRETLYLFEL